MTGCGELFQLNYQIKVILCCRRIISAFQIFAFSDTKLKKYTLINSSISSRMEVNVIIFSLFSRKCMEINSLLKSELMPKWSENTATCIEVN